MLGRRRFLGGGTAASLLPAGLFSCEGSKPSAPTAPQASAEAPSAPPRPRVALVMKTLTNPFFVAMERGARQAERTLGIDLVVRTAAEETSVEQQIAIVNDLIREHVDAIVIAPGDSYKLVPAVKAARDAGIVVVNIDNRLDPAYAVQVGLGKVPFISVDNHDGAYRAVRELTANIDAPTDAALIEGIRSAANAESRKQGALQAFAEKPHIRVVAQETANWKIDEAHDLMRGLLTKHPDIKLIYCANDMMALGVVHYLRESNRTDIKVGGYDALPEALPELQAGRLHVTVDQHAAEQGQRGVEAAVTLMRGGTVPDETMIPVAVVTPGSVPQ